MHPKFSMRKAYRVTVDKLLSPEAVERLERGVRLGEGVTLPALARIVPRSKNTVIELVIREGKNRQIHRMFEALGYRVEKLDRIAYADITYEGLPRGRWRHLTRKEIAKLSEGSEGKGPKSGF